MNSSEGSSTRMNYYVPRQQDDKTPPLKKKCIERVKPRHTPRILVRRFALTHTEHKYLDVGINVGTASSVGIILGDNRGNKLVFDYDLWSTFIEKRTDIERFLQSTVVTSLLILKDLTMTLCKIRDHVIVVKLVLNNSCIYMKPSTVLFLFELESCVDYEYCRLFGTVETVNERFDYLVCSLQSDLFAPEKDKAVKILRDAYNKKSIIDCELVTYAVDELLRETVERGDVW